MLIRYIVTKLRRVGVSSDSLGVVSDPHGVSSDPQGVSSDPEGVSSDPEGVSSDPNVVPSESNHHPMYEFKLLYKTVCSSGLVCMFCLELYIIAGTLHVLCQSVYILLKSSKSSATSKCLQ